MQELHINKRKRPPNTKRVNQTASTMTDLQDELVMKTNLELQRIATPVLIRMQRPWLAAGLAIPIVFFMAVLMARLYLTTTARLFVGWTGVGLGMATGFIFLAVGRIFQARFQRCAGYIAVAAWCVFYLCFAMQIPDGGTFAIYTFTPILKFSPIFLVYEARPFDFKMVIFVADVLTGFYIAYGLCRWRHTRGGLYKAAKQAQKESENQTP